MKRFLFIAAATLVGFTLTGCSYDDSAIWDAMDELEEKVEQNAEDIATLSALIEASNQGKVITSTEYTTEGVVLLTARMAKMVKMVPMVRKARKAMLVKMVPTAKTVLMARTATRSLYR